ncbi:MAG: flagellar assembly protein FliH [Myxococcota bacterium]|nr:flagellar assembly protein FliH [Myxococcota bacterium]
MTAPRARILRGPAVDRASPLLSPGLGAAQYKRVAREEIDALLNAERILAEAQAAADRLLSDAGQAAALAVERAEHTIAEQVEARTAARLLRLRSEEASRLAGEVDRVVALAVVLAERLLGAALELDPARIAEMARVVVAEARGARRVVIEAHPLDADALRKHLVQAAIDLPSLEVREDVTLARGALRLHTDVGTIDAKLTPRLERLAAALRDALQ